MPKSAKSNAPMATLLAATLVRFLLFRSWVFPRKRTASAPVAAPDRRTVR